MLSVPVSVTFFKWLGADFSQPKNALLMKGLHSHRTTPPVSPDPTLGPSAPPPSPAAPDPPSQPFSSAPCDPPKPDHFRGQILGRFLAKGLAIFEAKPWARFAHSDLALQKSQFEIGPNVARPLARKRPKHWPSESHLFNKTRHVDQDRP